MSEEQTNNLIVEMIRSLKSDNKTEHCDLKKTIKGIMTRQDITNGNITAIKTKQLYLRGILIGGTVSSGIILFLTGKLPDKITELIKIFF